MSVRYGIITPYTSFLVEEPELALSQEGRQQLAQDEFAAAEAAPPAAVSGEAAVSKAIDQNALQDAEMAAPLPMPTSTTGGGGPSAQPGESATAVVTVGEKAFVLREGVWTDTTFDPATMTTIKLPFGSDELLQLAGRAAPAGPIFRSRHPGDCGGGWHRLRDHRHVNWVTNKKSPANLAGLFFGSITATSCVA